MPALTGSPPWSVERVVLSSATDWVLYTLPAWVRQVLVKNEHASGILYVGRCTETGTYDGTNDEYIAVAAGASVTIPIARGLATAPSSHLVIPLASATASLPAALVYSEAP